MGLFKPDLYRNFGIGFLVGALLVGASLAPNLTTDIASPALAAPADEPSQSESSPAN
jgi:hypothetical protein